MGVEGGGGDGQGSPGKVHGSQEQLRTMCVSHREAVHLAPWKSRSSYLVPISDGILCIDVRIWAYGDRRENSVVVVRMHTPPVFGDQVLSTSLPVIFVQDTIHPQSTCQPQRVPCPKCF